MKEAEDKVESWLLQYQLVAKRYSKSELQSGIKTPDFRVLRNNTEQFLCEVKAVLERQQPTPEDSDAMPNQLSADIHKAYKQFKDSNPQHSVPNVLAFVHCSGPAEVDILEDVLLGAWRSESGQTMPIFTRIAKGRIKNEKRDIDLYLWHKQHNNVQFIFTGTRPQHLTTLCSLFGINEFTLPKIGG